MSQVTLQVRMLTGSLLELLSKQPELLSQLNFAIEADREKFKATCDISDKEVIASKFAPFLKSQSDNFYNLSSNDDFENRDVVGSYPADDPRGGWWLISMGYLFMHIVMGYIDTKKINPDDPFEGLICAFEEEDLDRLIEIYTIASILPETLTEEEYIEIDNLCRQYNKESVTTIHELLGDKLNKTLYLPERSYLQVSAYQPGVYIYSVDPEQPPSILNSVISIRRLDGSHYIYYFANSILNREPPFTLNSSLHDSIMNS